MDNSEINNEINVPKKGKLIIIKENFVYEEILIKEKGKVIARLNLNGEDIEIKIVKLKENING